MTQKQRVFMKVSCWRKLSSWILDERADFVYVTRFAHKNETIKKRMQEREKNLHCRCLCTRVSKCSLACCTYCVIHVDEIWCIDVCCCCVWPLSNRVRIRIWKCTVRCWGAQKTFFFSFHQKKSREHCEQQQNEHRNIKFMSKCNRCTFQSLHDSKIVWKKKNNPHYFIYFCAGYFFSFVLCKLIITLNLLVHEISLAWLKLNRFASKKVIIFLSPPNTLRFVDDRFNFVIFFISFRFIYF